MTKTPRKPHNPATPQKGPQSDALDDEELWRKYTSKITPLNTNKKITNISSSASSYVDRKPPTPPRRRAVGAPGRPSLAGASSRPFEHGKADGLDRTSQKQMRRGKITIEARLDLHGMTQTEAHRHLLGFLERAHLSGKRAVLVITGKGLSRRGDIGVLRQAVPRWLNEPPLKTWIRGFDYAAPCDGGEGALYILLRRRK